MRKLLTGLTLAATSYCSFSSPEVATSDNTYVVNCKKVELYLDHESRSEREHQQRMINNSGTLDRAGYWQVMFMADFSTTYLSGALFIKEDDGQTNFLQAHIGGGATSTSFTRDDDSINWRVERAAGFKTLIVAFDDAGLPSGFSFMSGPKDGVDDMYLTTVIDIKRTSNCTVKPLGDGTPLGMIRLK